MVKKIAFDKTGTLTMGQFALLHLNTFCTQFSREEILQRLSLMEERASHPLAQAIVQAAQSENISIPKGMKAKDHTQLAGEGIMAEINGKMVFVGNIRLFRRLGLFEQLPREQLQAAEEWSCTGGTVGFMSIEGSGIVCSFCVADAVRPESAQVVATLGDHGIDVTMLTGDNNEAANAIGKQVGLRPDQVQSDLLPEDKLTFVNGFKEGNGQSKSFCFNPCNSPRLVLMCGDGVNDAPALAAADVGVAMGAGAALAMETSDVTLLDSELDKLVYSLCMGRRVIRKIRENVIFSIVVKAIVVGFALAGNAQLWAAIASDVGAMLIVTINGMLLLPERKKDSHLSKKNRSTYDPEQILELPHASAGHATNASSCCGDNGLHRCSGTLEVVAENTLAPASSSCKKDGAGCCGGIKEAVRAYDATNNNDHGHSHAHGAVVDSEVATSCCKKDSSSGCSGANNAATETLKDSGCCGRTKDTLDALDSAHEHSHGHSHV